MQTCLLPLMSKLGSHVTLGQQYEVATMKGQEMKNSSKIGWIKNLKIILFQLLNIMVEGKTASSGKQNKSTLLSTREQNGQQLELYVCIQWKFEVI